MQARCPPSKTGWKPIPRFFSGGNDGTVPIGGVFHLTMSFVAQAAHARDEKESCYFQIARRFSATWKIPPLPTSYPLRIRMTVFSNPSKKSTLHDPVTLNWRKTPCPSQKNSKPKAARKVNLRGRRLIRMLPHELGNNIRIEQDHGESIGLEGFAISSAWRQIEIDSFFLPETGFLRYTPSRASN